LANQRRAPAHSPFDVVVGSTEGAMTSTG